MKKIVLSLAGVLAATAFAPEASAIPAYARQVGMACSACHQQHFPILNSFGRAFKAGGYTMMGAQGKVEGDHLSIPDTLNLSMIIKARYLKDNRTRTTGATNTRAANNGDGAWEMFDEFALLGGGRIADNVGFFFEGQMLQTGPLMGIMRMPFVWDMGGAKFSVVPFTTDGGGVIVGYELSSGGILRANRWAEDRSSTSAFQYTRGIETATGMAFVAQNDMGYINITPYSVSGAFKQVGAGSSWDSTYVRVAATPTVNDWAMVFGAGKMSGQSFNATTGTTGTAYKTDLTFFDFQAHGQVGGKDIGIYAQHSKAPHTTGFRNAYNNRAACVAACNPDKKATTIGVDYSVIPHALHLGAAYRSAKNGGTAAANGDNSLTLNAIYDLYQNVALHGWYNKFTGSSRNAAGSVTNAYSLMLEMAW
jgi:hypothetical protein